MKSDTWRFNVWSKSSAEIYQSRSGACSFLFFFFPKKSISTFEHNNCNYFLQWKSWIDKYFTSYFTFSGLFFFYVLVLFRKQRELGQGSRRKSTTFCCFIILAQCPGTLFPWQPSWMAYLLFSVYSACVCVCVYECACVGVPAEQFPLMKKARRRFLGDVMKYWEGNNACSWLNK